MHTQQIKRAEAQMILADAIEAHRPKEQIELVRRAVPHRDWQHAPKVSDCPCTRNELRTVIDCALCHGSKKVAGGIELGAGAMSSYGERSVVMINSTEKRAIRYGNAYVLSFGSYGWTNVHVYANDVDDAIEQAAEWLVVHAPGHIMVEGDEHLESLRKEACEEAGLAWPMPAFGPDTFADDQQPYWDAYQEAEADLLYTESGYLTAHEVHVALTNPTVEELYNFVTGGNR